MYPIKAWVVRHAGTPSERRELVYHGDHESFGAATIRMAIADGQGAWGYVERDGERVSYHSGSSFPLRPVA